MSKPKPYFSIIIPMYNREEFISRALDSCLNQDFQDFEIIVVDDGSTDGSVAKVKNYHDPRLTLLLHSMNRGVGSARNTGAKAARGEWFIFLDSDDELLPGALSIMRQRTGGVGDEIASLRFMVCMGNGALSPDPPLKDETWDYEAYVRAYEACLGRKQESLQIVRRKIFEQYGFSEIRTIGDYFLDLSQRFLIRTYPEVVRIYHQDAKNQITCPSATQILLGAPDLAKHAEGLLSRHAEALKVWAPRLYWQQISGLVSLQFLSSHRRKGWQAGLTCLRMRPFSAKVWLTMLLGSVDPRLLAWIKSKLTHIYLAIKFKRSILTHLNNKFKKCA